MPTELELKLALPPQALPALQALPAFHAHLDGPVSQQLLRAHYFDTPDQQLARAGMALRLRQEGRGWVQALKAAQGPALAMARRGEWEHPVPGPQLDLRVLAGTPLAALPQAESLPRRLRRAFTVRVQRRSWPLAWVDGSRAELCIDQGEIACGAGASRRTAPICELELELIAGDAGRLWKLAQQLAEQVPLMPLAASKAERGFELARGPAGPMKARPPRIDEDQPLHAVLHAMVAAALAALQHNLRHLAPAEPEYVHQARVALRRLRSLLRAVEPLPELAPLRKALRALREPLRGLGRLLGVARDADVFALETLPALRQALGDAHAPALDRVAERVQARRAAAYAELAAAALRPGSGLGLLRAERLAWALEGLGTRDGDEETGADIADADAPGDEAADGTTAESPRPHDRRHDDARSPREVGALLLRHAHERVWRAGRDLARLSDEDRHQLRIEVKRLRYLLDGWHGLWPGERVRPYRDALAALQDDLGALNDAAVAGEMLALLEADPALRAAWARRERKRLRSALPQVAAHLTALELTEAPWR